GRKLQQLNDDDDDEPHLRRTPAANLQFIPARELLEQDDTRSIAENYPGPSSSSSKFGGSGGPGPRSNMLGVRDSGKAKDFESLLSSSNTVKLSSTPDRMKGMEVRPGGKPGAPPVPPPKIKYQAKEAAVSKSDSNSLADFLRNTGPEDQNAAKPLKSALASKSAVEEKTAAMIRSKSAGDGIVPTSTSTTAVVPDQPPLPTATSTPAMTTAAPPPVPAVSTSPKTSAPNSVSGSPLGSPAATRVAPSAMKPAPATTKKAAVEDDDSDFEDDYFQPRRKNKEKEMSLADFLRSSEPPAPPAPAPVPESKSRSKSSNSGGSGGGLRLFAMGRNRTTSVSEPNESSSTSAFSSSTSSINSRTSSTGSVNASGSASAVTAPAGYTPWVNTAQSSTNSLLDDPNIGSPGVTGSAALAAKEKETSSSSGGGLFSSMTRSRSNSASSTETKLMKSWGFDSSTAPPVPSIPTTIPSKKKEDVKSPVKTAPVPVPVPAPVPVPVVVPVPSEPLPAAVRAGIKESAVLEEVVDALRVVDPVYVEVYEVKGKSIDISSTEEVAEPIVVDSETVGIDSNTPGVGIEGSVLRKLVLSSMSTQTESEESTTTATTTTTGDDASTQVTSSTLAVEVQTEAMELFVMADGVIAESIDTTTGTIRVRRAVETCDAEAQTIHDVLVAEYEELVEDYYYDEDGNVVYNGMLEEEVVIDDMGSMVGSPVNETSAHEQVDGEDHEERPFDDLDMGRVNPEDAFTGVNSAEGQEVIRSFDPSVVQSHREAEQKEIARASWYERKIVYEAADRAVEISEESEDAVVTETPAEIVAGEIVGNMVETAIATVSGPVIIETMASVNSNMGFDDDQEEDEPESDSDDEDGYEAPVIPTETWSSRRLSYALDLTDDERNPSSDEKKDKKKVKKVKSSSMKKRSKTTINEVPASTDVSDPQPKRDSMSPAPPTSSTSAASTVGVVEEVLSEDEDDHHPQDHSKHRHRIVAQCQSCGSKVILDQLQRNLKDNLGDVMQDILVNGFASSVHSELVHSTTNTEPAEAFHSGIQTEETETNQSGNQTDRTETFHCGNQTESVKTVSSSTITEMKATVDAETFTETIETGVANQWEAEMLLGRIAELEAKLKVVEAEKKGLERTVVVEKSKRRVAEERVDGLLRVALKKGVDVEAKKRGWEVPTK
ncbi:hypothetical protein HDU76_006552, partial [Blyttiomyces sp. JEL0837]